MKTTNTNLANYFGLTRQTIATWKKSKPKIYEALVNQYIKDHFN